MELDISLQILHCRKHLIQLRWEALKCCVRGHTISFSSNKKKMLSAKQDNLESLIKHEEQKLLFATTSQSSLIMQKIASFQNE